MRYLLPIVTALVVVAGCAEEQPMTVSQFLENETALYGTLERCQNDPETAKSAECRNARAAGERISVIEERALHKAQEQAFISAREEYRERLDRERELRRQAEAEAAAARLEMLTTTMPDEAPDEAPDDGADEQDETASSEPPETTSND